MKKMMSEFKDFISRGNVIDLAIGVIIGGAFGKIVSSLVDDIIMPLVGIIVGGVDFTNLFYAFDGKEYASLDAAKESTATIAYGSFIQNVVNFLIIAFVIFIFVKKLSDMAKRFKKEEKAGPATKKICDFCKTEIAIDAIRCPYCTSELK